MFISKRFEYYDLTGEVNPITKAYLSYKNSGKPIYDLTVSNPTKVSISYPHSEILECLSNVTSLVYEPHPRGLYTARESICEYYKSQGFNITPEDLFLTSGTSEAYSYILKLLCDPGDEVLIPAPSYPLFDFIALLESVKLKFYCLDCTGTLKWRISKDSILKNINEHTKAIILVQPNNPTGNILSLDEIENLISIAEHYNLALVIDEVFRDYTFSTNKPRLLYSNKVPIFTLNGISKTLGLPQMKLSWIVVSASEEIKKEIEEALEIIADTYLSVNTPVQVALPKLFNLIEPIQSEIRKRLLNNLDYVMNLLSGNPIVKTYNPDGGWYLVIGINNFNGDDEKTVVKLLYETGVYVHPGSMFRFPSGGFIVVSLLPEEEVFQVGIQRLCNYFQSTIFG